MFRAARSKKALRRPIHATSHEKYLPAAFMMHHRILNSERIYQCDDSFVKWHLLLDLWNFNGVVES